MLKDGLNGVLTSLIDQFVLSFRATLTSSKSGDDCIISYSVSPTTYLVTVLSILEVGVCMWYAGVVEWHWCLSRLPEVECVQFVCVNHSKNHTITWTAIDTQEAVN